MLPNPTDWRELELIERAIVGISSSAAMERDWGEFDFRPQFGSRLDFGQIQDGHTGFWPVFGAQRDCENQAKR